jgi:hypothetical protein
MQRYSIAAMVLLFSTAAAVVVLHARSPEGRPEHAAADAEPAIDATLDVASADAGTEEQPAEEPDAARWDSAVARALPNGAPQTVTFGVILFRYRGAEEAPKTAPAKAEARQKAEQALAQAKENFADAVKYGDVGSTADAGRIRRGVLEADLEYTLFTLAASEVYPEPLDTPRGYWVVRRND